MVVVRWEVGEVLLVVEGEGAQLVNFYVAVLMGGAVPV
jgi:hypothetical protein